MNIELWVLSREPEKKKLFCFNGSLIKLLSKHLRTHLLRRNSLFPLNSRNNGHFQDNSLN